MPNMVLGTGNASEKQMHKDPFPIGNNIFHEGEMEKEKK